MNLKLNDVDVPEEDSFEYDSLNRQTNLEVSSRDMRRSKTLITELDQALKKVEDLSSEYVDWEDVKQELRNQD